MRVLHFQENREYRKNNPPTIKIIPLCSRSLMEHLPCICCVDITQVHMFMNVIICRCHVIFWVFHSHSI